MLKIGSCVEKPGSTNFGSMKIVQDYDGTFFEVPLSLIGGKEAGPKLVLIAGVHGDEVAGMVAVQKLIHFLDPKQIKGTVVAIPMIDPTAFEHTEKYSRVDNKDFSCCFPGEPEGTYGERLAYQISQQIFSKLGRNDLVIALHGGGQGRQLIPHVIILGGETDLAKRRLELGYATGVKILDIILEGVSDKIVESEKAERSGRRQYPAEAFGEKIRGNIDGYLASLGVPELTFESGSQYMAKESDVEVHFQSVLNVMKFMGMIEGSPKKTAERIIIHESRRVNATRRGFWFPKVSAGDKIRKGDMVGVVNDVFGRKIEELTSPFDGIALLVRYRTMVDPLSSKYQDFYGVLIGKREKS